MNRIPSFSASTPYVQVTTSFTLINYKKSPTLSFSTLLQFLYPSLYTLASRFKAGCFSLLLRAASQRSPAVLQSNKACPFVLKEHPDITVTLVRNYANANTCLLHPQLCKPPSRNAKYSLVSKMNIHSHSTTSGRNFKFHLLNLLCLTAVQTTQLLICFHNQSISYKL